MTPSRGEARLLANATARTSTPPAIETRRDAARPVGRPHQGSPGDGRPAAQYMAVAEKMGWQSEQPLRDYCRELGIEDWHDVHPIVAAADI